MRGWKIKRTRREIEAHEAAEAAYEEFWRDPKIDEWFAEAFPHLPALPPALPPLPDDAPGDFDVVSDAVSDAVSVSSSVDSLDSVDSIFQDQGPVSVDDLMEMMEGMFDRVDLTEDGTEDGTDAETEKSEKTEFETAGETAGETVVDLT